MAKLLIQGIPNFLPSEELLLLPGSFTIEAEPSQNSQAGFYHASAVFQNPEEAWQTFQEFEGEDVSIFGWSEKKILFRSHSGKILHLKIVNMLPRPAGLPPAVTTRSSRVVEADLGPGVWTRKRKAEGLRQNPTAVTVADEELDAKKLSSKLLRELNDDRWTRKRKARRLLENFPGVVAEFTHSNNAAGKIFDGEWRAKRLRRDEASEADVALRESAKKRMHERMLIARQNEPILAKKFRSILEKHAAVNNSGDSIKKKEVEEREVVAIEA